MTRRSLIHNGIYLFGFFTMAKYFNAAAAEKDACRVRLLRHATLLVEIGNRRILIDPMLGKKESMEPAAPAGNDIRFPMVDLPITDDELKAMITTIDAVLLTHTHRDHWDPAAQQSIPKDTPVICQPVDEEKIRSQGFTTVKSVERNFSWHGITIDRTSGKHGTGEIGKKMGVTSGFVLTAGVHRLYIAGDTIWCDDVMDAITTHQPTHIIANGGGAQFLQGGPITMTVDDILEMSRFTQTRIDVVHLETVNHCFQRRNDFRSAIADNSLSGRLSVPADGEWLVIQ